jgi:chromate transport protein ChrA
MNFIQLLATAPTEGTSSSGGGLMAFLPLIILISVVVLIVRAYRRSPKERESTEIICPNVNCGYKGVANKESRGSWIAAFILLWLFVLPGLIYIIFFQGFRVKCPKCNLQVSSD